MADTGGSSKDTTAGSKSSSLSRKRKAEEISDDTDENADALHLPAPVWGHVLDFMPYGEVRSALLVGKHIAVEAAKYVQTINIMRACKMHIAAARRFSNFTEVNVLCLLQGTGTFFVRNEQCTLSLDVASRIMPFLASLTKIRRGFVGGILKHKNRDTGAVTYHRQPYEPNSGSQHFIDEQHADAIFRNLLTAYVGAIKTGALSDVKLRGVRDSLFWIAPCPHRSPNCQWCRDILLHFPIHDLLEFLAYYNDEEVQDICQSKENAWKIVLKRPDAAQGIKDVSEKLLCGNATLQWTGVKAPCRAAAARQLPTKWRTAEQRCKDAKVWFCGKIGFANLDNLIEKGFDTKLISRKYVLEQKAQYIGADSFNHWEGNDFFCNDFHAWKRSTVEGLAARGFPIDCDCIPIIDDEYCQW